MKRTKFSHLIEMEINKLFRTNQLASRGKLLCNSTRRSVFSMDIFLFYFELMRSKHFSYSTDEFLLLKYRLLDRIAVSSSARRLFRKKTHLLYPVSRY